ncbi:hypothetical protein [Burkholderia seminalis]|uniref:hypothetical protein n=1 Tax=Burkholderia seminalis TaxID=488731 RepID=UPI0019038F2D|nr:hypothetical protein [Burkholderia seminalis]MBJ9967851.1 hypothetical protein [Burkholderia seminalis]
MADTIDGFCLMGLTMTLLDRVLAHAAATQRQQLTGLNTPIRYAGQYGDTYTSRNVPQFELDVDTLLFIRPYTDPDTGRMIRCLADVDAGAAA